MVGPLVDPLTIALPVTWTRRRTPAVRGGYRDEYYHYANRYIFSNKAKKYCVKIHTTRPLEERVHTYSGLSDLLLPTANTRGSLRCLFRFSSVFFTLFVVCK